MALANCSAAWFSLCCCCSSITNSFPLAFLGSSASTLAVRARLSTLSAFEVYAR